MGAHFLLPHSYTIVYRNFSDRLTNGALDLFGIIHFVVPGAQTIMVYKMYVVSAGEKITRLVSILNINPLHQQKGGFLKNLKIGFLFGYKTLHNIFIFSNYQ